MTVVIAYVATLVVFAIIDTLWLGVVARGFYAGELGSLLAPEIKLWAAMLFYVVYAAGIVVFAVMPALRAGSVLTAIRMGGLSASSLMPPMILPISRRSKTGLGG